MDAMSHDCCSIRLDCQTQELPLTIQSVHDTAYEVKLVQDAQTNIPPRSQLPQDLVIKPLKKDPDLEYTDQMETLVYERLSHLQGRLIPRYYGVGDFCLEGKTVKAHVLERVNGTPLTEIDKADWNKLDIERKIKEAYTELSQQGVKHRDVEARHIFLIPGSEYPMLIDFGLAKLCGCVDAEAQNTNDVEGLFRKLDK
jgi:serine/threonine protein kinase